MLTISTGKTVATYSGLTLKKVGGAYELMSRARTPAQARAGGPVIPAHRPILSEKVLTAGHGKNKHAVGIEITFEKPLDTLLKNDLGGNSSSHRAKPVSIRVTYASSTVGGTVKLAANATSESRGRIVVVSR
jgi:hypothetical protein